MLTADVRDLFASDDGITLIITIGNSFRSDDGVGPHIYANVKCQMTNAVPAGRQVKLLNAEDKPENILDEAIALKPSRTIIIDAADFGGCAGEARIIDEEKIPNSTLSTHTFPIPIIARMLEKDTGSKVVFLGIQPKSVEFGEGLSEEVKKTADEIVDLVNGGQLCMKCI